MNKFQTNGQHIHNASNLIQIIEAMEEKFNEMKFDLTLELESQNEMDESAKPLTKTADAKKVSVKSVCETVNSTTRANSRKRKAKL